MEKVEDSRRRLRVSGWPGGTVFDILAQRKWRELGEQRNLKAGGRDEGKFENQKRRVARRVCGDSACSYLRLSGESSAR